MNSVMDFNEELGKVLINLGARVKKERKRFKDFVERNKKAELTGKKTTANFLGFFLSFFVANAIFETKLY